MPLFDADLRALMAVIDRSRDGIPIKVVKCASDITARKLQVADALGQLAAVNRSQAVIAFAPDATVLDANANLLEALGYGRRSVIRSLPAVSGCRRSLVSGA